MSTQGLSRFARSMPTKFKGTCEFCGTATRPGIDHAARNGASWIAVCATCATSITEQVKAVVRVLQEAMPAMSAEVISNAQTMLPASDALQAAMQPGASETLAYDVLAKLQCAQVYVKAATRKADPVLDGLQAVINNAQASAKDRTVAADMSASFAKYGSLTERQASYAQSIIDRYQGGAAAPVAAAKATSTVPAGYYATPSRTGNNDLDFWRIDAPETGKWAGYTFVKRLLGGHDPINVRGAEAKIALAAIADYGIEAAGKRYAAEYTRCYKCNRELTDEASRAAGLGPICRG